MKKKQVTEKRFAFSVKQLLFKNLIVYYKKVFSLLELLFIIAIIVILISLLLPALKTSRDAAKRMKCAGNEKQIGAALMFYVADYDNYMPKCGASPYYWYDQLWSGGQYLSDPRRYFNEEVNRIANKGTVYQCPSGEGYRCEYAVNYQLGFQRHLKFGFLAKDDTSNPKAEYSLSLVAWLGEGDIWFWRSMSSQPVKFRHNNKTNILYLDQHVEIKSYSYIVNSMTSRLPWGIWW